MSSFIDALDTALAQQGYDLTDHSSFSGSLMMTNLVFAILVIISTVLRGISVYCYMNRKWDMSDTCMYFAFFMAVAFCFNNKYGASRGVGQHIWDTGYLTDPAQFPEKANSITLNLYISYVLYIFSTLGTKLSLICHYQRIFPRSISPNFFYLNAGMAIMVISVAVVSVITLIFECHPIQSSWNWDVPRDYCIDIQAFFNITSTINVTMDIILVVAPLRLLWQINNTRAKRVTLCALYGAGICVCIAGLMRIYFLQGLQSLDTFYTSGRGLTWSAVEICLGIICTNVPSMKPLFLQWWLAIRLFSSHRTTRITVFVAKIWSKLDFFYHMKIRPYITDRLDSFLLRNKHRLCRMTGELPTGNIQASMTWEEGFIKEHDVVNLTKISRPTTSSADTDQVDSTDISEAVKVDATSMV